MSAKTITEVAREELLAARERQEELLGELELARETYEQSRYGLDESAESAALAAVEQAEARVREAHFESVGRWLEVLALRSAQ